MSTTTHEGPRGRHAGRGPFRNIDMIEAANREAGHHFFEPGTKHFFSSRILPTVYGGRYFVTSERRGFDDYRRAYTVRVARDSGRIETVGDFLTYTTRPGAVRAAEQAARAIPEVRHDPYEGTPDERARKRDHFNWRVYVAGTPIGPRTTYHKAHTMRRELGRIRP